MNSKVEVLRDFNSTPSSLLNVILPDINESSPGSIIEESTPLIGPDLEEKTLASRGSNKKKKDKEMIRAAILASDSTLRGKVLRPAHIFSRPQSNGSPILNGTIPDKDFNLDMPNGNKLHSEYQSNQ